MKLGNARMPEGDCTMRTAICALGIAVLLGGCTGNLADIVKAHGESVRSSYLRINSIYINSVSCGTGQVNVTVLCNAEGMTIRALGDSVDRALAVPVTIKPIELVPTVTLPGKP